MNNKISTKQLTPQEIRAYCLLNKKNVFDFFVEGSPALIQIEKPEVSLSIKRFGERVTKRDIILDVIEKFKNKNGDHYHKFDDFVQEFEKECRSEGVYLDSSVPAAGQAASELYFFAIEQQKKKNPRAYRVGEDDLDSSIGICFYDKKRIVGKLNREYISKNYPIVDRRIVHRDLSGKVNEDTRIECCRRMPLEPRQKIRETLTRLVDQYISPKSNQNINYLSNEDPHFENYLSLLQLAEKNRSFIIPLFLKKDNRETNVMRSVINTYHNEFNGASLLKGNTDNLILLDFPVTNKFTIIRDPQTGNSYVSYWENSVIPVSDYHAIIDNLDKVSKNQASKKFKICKDFIREASNRYEGVFNVVFLDYVGSHIHNRDDVIEAIAKRRLSNNSIFSFARELRTDKRPIFENARNIFIEQGYEVSDIASQNYPSQIDFHSYLLRK